MVDVVLDTLETIIVEVPNDEEIQIIEIETPGAPGAPGEGTGLHADLTDTDTDGHPASAITGLGTAALVNTGTGATNAILGNDARLTDARTPLSHSHPATDVTFTPTTSGDWTSSPDQVGEALDELAARPGGSSLHADLTDTDTDGHPASAITGLGTAALVDTGTGATNAILGNDARLTDARTPLSHAHASTAITFTPTNSGDWTSAPDQVGEALDELAARSGGSGLHADLTDTATDGHPASVVTFDNSGTSLTADDVQAALEELANAAASSGSRFFGAYGMNRAIFDPQVTPQPPEIPLPAGTPVISFTVDSSLGFESITNVRFLLGGGVGSTATLVTSLSFPTHYGYVIEVGNILTSGAMGLSWVMVTLDGSTLIGVPAGLTAQQIATGNTVWSSLAHNHSGVYSTTGHNHDGTYATAGHNHDATYSLLGHDHDGDYLTAGTTQTVLVEAVTVLTEITGAATATVKLNGGDTTLPNVEVIGDQAEADEGVLLYASWPCPAAPSVDHKLVGVRVWDMEIDYTGFGGVQTQVSIFADGVPGTSLNSGFGFVDSNLASVVLSYSNPPSYYNQAAPAQADYRIAPITGVDAGDYHVMLGFQCHVGGGTPEVLPLSVTASRMAWIWEVDPILVDETASNVVVTWDSGVPEGVVDLQLHANQTSTVGVTVEGDDLSNVRVRVMHPIDTDVVLGTIWAGTSGSFANVGGHLHQVSSETSNQEAYIANLASTTAVRRRHTGLVSGTSTPGGETIYVDPGNPHPITLDNINATEPLTMVLMGDRALTSGGDTGDWAVNHSWSVTIQAGESATFHWDWIRLEYIREYVQVGFIEGPGSSTVSNFASWGDSAASTLEDSGVSASDFAAATHGHSGSDITSGTVPFARLPVGTTSTTVLAGDTVIPAAYTDEQVRDVIGAALVAGSNVTITVDDGANTITIAASGGGGSVSPSDGNLVVGMLVLGGQ